MKTPPGYTCYRHGARTCFLKEEHADALRHLGFDTGEPTAEPIGTTEGRRPHRIFVLGEERGETVSVIWKRCRRGGLMEPLLGDRHLGAARFVKEIDLTERARAAGVRVAETLGLAIEKGAAGWKRAEMITRVVADARDLESALVDGAMPAARRRSVVRAVAGELRRFHGHGFLHGDLNVKNVLWRDAGDRIEVTLIDLDPGGMWRNGELPTPGSTPQGNLLRLFRSYRKGVVGDRWRFSLLDLYGFLEEYFRGDRAGLQCFWKTAARQRRFTGSRLRPRQLVRGGP